ncbi:MAG: site-specific DNA-methyltransferase [Candidatus Bathyarchaeia archaeon]|nr:site-specific DNA-methyltransferase [Candidatus Bathyarchaeia archaeon]
MVNKILKKTEVLRGFIHIPTESRFELVGSIHLPCPTMLNGKPARLDKYGRLWSPYLKNRFSIGTRIELTKAENGYQVALSKSEHKSFISKMKQEEVMSVSNDSESETNVYYKVLKGDCLKYLDDGAINNIHLTFLDPPYRQGKDYRFFDDDQPAWKYWSWLKEILHKVYDATASGGAIYFMQREKKAEHVLKVLRETGWKFQNLIVWKKKTSAVPCAFRFSKQYQIIAYATKGDKPRVFNKLRIDLPTLPGHKYERENGIFLTDVWDDVRELTSGYFAGDEAIRDDKGNRVHTQQSPVALLLRIILSSTLPGNTVLDPLAGTGTTLVVAYQLKRNSIGIEIDPEHVKVIKNRLKSLRPADDISKYYDYYRFTPNLREIWPVKRVITEQRRLL